METFTFSLNFILLYDYIITLFISVVVLMHGSFTFVSAIFKDFLTQLYLVISSRTNTEKSFYAYNNVLNLQSKLCN